MVRYLYQLLNMDTFDFADILHSQDSMLEFCTFFEKLLSLPENSLTSHVEPILRLVYEDPINGESLFELFTQLFPQIPGDKISQIRSVVLVSNRLPFSLMRKFFHAIVLLLHGDIEQSAVLIKEVALSEEVLKMHGMKREALEGLFCVIDGVIHKDTTKLVAGIVPFKE